MIPMIYLLIHMPSVLQIMPVECNDMCSTARMCSVQSEFSSE